MTLPLNKEMVERAYAYLRCTPPFNRWKMPPAGDVKFAIGRFRRDYAQYQWDGKQHSITLSVNAIGHTRTLMEKLSHEMIHLHLEERGLESRRGGADTHNARFRRFAAVVCKNHGFDPKGFY